MNVLMVSSSYPKFKGDVTAPFIESIATGIAARGHRVAMVLPEHPDLRRAAVEEGVHFYPYRYAPARSWTVWGYAESMLGDVKLKRKTYLLAPVVFISALATIRRAARAEGADIVHAHWVLPNAPMAALAAGERRLPLVISLHGSDIFLAEKNAALGKLARRCFDAAVAITGPSEDLLSRAGQLGAVEEKLELVPYGADWKGMQASAEAGKAMRTRLGVPEGRLMVLAIGRMVYKKGFAVLLDALRFAPAEVHLVLAGDGDLRTQLEAQARAQGLAGRVHFAGWVARGEIPALLAACDLFAVPSVRDAAGNVDGLPNTALEAMAAGKPLIASRVGGLPQVIEEGVSGVLVPEQDPQALGEAITRLAQDPQVRVRMGTAARARVRSELNWERVTDRFSAIYQRVLAAGAHT